VSGRVLGNVMRYTAVTPELEEAIVDYIQQ